MSLDVWLRGRTPSPATPEHLVERYLAAFGPADAADVERWSGLPGLAGTVDAMDLVRLTTEDGRVLFDLPDAPRPDADTPAPARFIARFDKLAASYADPSRWLADDRGLHRWSGPGALLLDGLVAGAWFRRGTYAAPILHLAPFRPFTDAERDDVRAEAAAMLDFLAPGGAGTLYMGATVAATPPRR